MRRLILALALVAGCGNVEPPTDALYTVSGHLQADRGVECPLRCGVRGPTTIDPAVSDDGACHTEHAWHPESRSFEWREVCERSNPDTGQRQLAITVHQATATGLDFVEPPQSYAGTCQEILLEPDSGDVDVRMACVMEWQLVE